MQTLLRKRKDHICIRFRHSNKKDCIKSFEAKLINYFEYIRVNKKALLI